MDDMQVVLYFTDGESQYQLSELVSLCQMFEDLFGKDGPNGGIINIPFKSSIFSDYILSRRLKKIRDFGKIYDLIHLEKYLCVHQPMFDVNFIVYNEGKISEDTMIRIINEFEIIQIEKLFIDYDVSKNDFVYKYSNTMYNKIINSYDDITNIPLIIYQRIATCILDYIISNSEYSSKLEQCKNWFYNYRTNSKNFPCLSKKNKYTLIKKLNDPIFIILVLRWEKQIGLLNNVDVLDIIINAKN